MIEIDSASLEASLDDLKSIYRILTEHQGDYPELAENGFFASLRLLLETQAQAEGVDIEDTHEWAAWLQESAAPPAVETPRELLN